MDDGNIESGECEREREQDRIVSTGEGRESMLCKIHQGGSKAFGRRHTCNKGLKHRDPNHL